MDTTAHQFGLSIVTIDGKSFSYLFPGQSLSYRTWGLCRGAANIVVIIIVVPISGTTQYQAQETNSGRDKGNQRRGEYHFVLILISVATSVIITMRVTIVIHGNLDPSLQDAIVRLTFQMTVQSVVRRRRHVQNVQWFIGTV